MRRIIAAAGLCAALAAGLAAGTQQTAATEVLQLEQWVTGVTTHRPGMADDGVATLRQWSPEVRKRLEAPLALFERAMLETGLLKPSPSIEEQRIIALGRQTEQAVGARTFLLRAAVLHTDAAIIDDASHAEAAAGRPSGDRGLVTATDGTLVGGSTENWNWKFARDLLDVVPRDRDADGSISRWYHATTAYFLQRGLYVQAEQHLAAAERRLPDEALVLFDQGCRFESLGMPFSQQILSEEALIARRLATTSNRWILGTEPRQGAFTNIPLPEVANKRAEDFYRNALKQSPSAPEPRVRLGRLLMVRGDYKGAGEALQQALGNLSRTESDPALRYYAYLFVSRVSQATGDLDAADASVAQALSLFPGAQSAVLAASQLRLRRADVAGALEPLDRLAYRAPGAAVSNDPWWNYHLCAGRNANTLIRDMWLATPAVPGGS